MSNSKELLNDSLRRSAAVAAKARSKAAEEKVRAAMRLIDLEIIDNQSAYPGGKLNQRELCRRAGVHYQTLQQPLHKDSLKRDVDNWLELKSTAKTNRETRKVVTDRAEHWKEQHNKVTTQICIYEAELAECRTRIAELEEEVSVLREQNAAIQRTNVMSISHIRKLEE